MARVQAFRRLWTRWVRLGVTWARVDGGRNGCPLRKRAAVPVGLVAALVLFGGLIAPQTTAAQEDTILVSLLKGPDRSSPQAWITSFIAEAEQLETLLMAYATDRTAANLQAYSSQLEVLYRFFDLDAFPPAFRTAVGSEAAVQMIDILNRLPADQILPDNVPTGPEAATDRVWALPGTDIVLIQRQEGADAGNYVMPRDVTAQLPDFRETVMSLPLLRGSAYRDMRSAQANLTGPGVPPTIATALSGWMDAPLLGVPSWKLLVAFVAFIATLAGNFVVLRIVRAASRFRSADFAAWLGVLGPLTLAVSCSALALFCLTQLILQGTAALLVIGLRNLCLIIAAAWAILSVSNIVTETLIGYETGPDRKMDADLTRLVGKTLGVVGAIAVFTFGLGTLGVPTAGIITSLGVGGVGIAFAARVTMENLFGGFLLLIDRPFRIGDHIKTKDGEGVVTNIGVRSCRIETVDGNTLTIPNGALSASAITKVQPRHAVNPDNPSS